MLDQLGLGIVLTLEDEFTPKANSAIASMERLQVGATDLERNMQRSMSNLQNIMLAGFSLDQVGQSFQTAGQNILGTFATIIGEVANVNASFETMRAQFKTVFGNDAEFKLNWATDLSAKTPFQVSDVARSMQKLSYANIDVTKSYTGVNGEVKSLMEYMGDFSTKNMEQGVNGLGIAMSNAIGGQWKSLRDRFDLTAEQVDGLKAGLEAGGTETFLDAFVNLASNITPNAMKNMEGTWEQVISNMKDNWDIFLWRVGDAGAFKPLKDTLGKVSVMLGEFIGKPELIATIGQTIAELWVPVDKLVTLLIKGVQAMAEFAQAHPKIAKLVIGFTAFTGVALVLTGTIFRAVGGFLILATSITSAYANLVVMNTLGKVNNFAHMNLSIGKIAGTIGALGIVAGAVAYAYMNNLGGMRDKVDELKQTWGLAVDYFKSYNFSNELITNNERMGNTMEAMAGKLAKFAFIGSMAFKTISGDTNYTQEQIDMMHRLGLNPLMDTIYKMGQNGRALWDGFVDGLQVAVDLMKTFLDVALIPVKAVYEAILDYAPLKDVLGFGNDDIDNLKTAGRLVGGLVGAFAGLKVISSLGKIITSPFSTLFKFLEKSRTSTRKLSEELSGMTKRNTDNDIVTGKNGKVFTNGSLLGQLNTSKQEIGSAGRTIGGAVTGTLTGARNAFTGTKNYIQGFPNRFSNAKANWNQSKIDKLNLPASGSSMFKEPREGYTQVAKKDAPYKLANYIDNPNSDALYKSNKGSKVSKFLFGESYSSKDGKHGALSSIGKYGGLFGKNRDDKQLRLALESKGGMASPSVAQLKGYGGSAKSTFANLIGQNKSAGTLRALKDNPYQAFGEDKSMYAGQLKAMEKSGFKNLSFRKRAYSNAGYSGSDFAGANVKGIMAEKRLKAQQKSLFQNQLKSESPAYAEAYSSGNKKKMKSMEGSAFKDPSFKNRAYATLPSGGSEFSGIGANKGIKTKQRQVLGTQLLKENPLYKETYNRFNQGPNTSLPANANLYKAKQSGISKALFGQKIYTPDRDSRGQYYQRQVATTGGIFRKKSNDMVFNDKGRPLADRIRTGYANSKLGGLTSKISNFNTERKASNKDFNTRAWKATKEVVGEKASGVSKKVLSPLNNQRARLGMDPVRSVFKSTTNPLTGAKSRSLMGMLGASVLSRPKLGATGAVLSKGGLLNRAGLGIKGAFTKAIGTGMKGVNFSKAVGGKIGAGMKTAWGAATKVGRGIGTVGRGIGAVGRGVGTVGRIAGRGIGAGVGAVGRGVGAVGRGAMRLGGGAMMAGYIGKMGYDAIKAKGGGDFKAGIGELQKSVASMDFGKMFDSFKSNVSAMGPLLKDIFAKLSVELPPILANAWEGIKAMAGLAWQWILQNGGQIMSTLGSVSREIFAALWEGVKVVAGFAWTWIQENGGTVMGTLFETIKGLAGTAWEWIKTDGYDLLCQMISDAGAWIGDVGIPTIVEKMKGIANYLKDDAIPSMLSALATFATEGASKIKTGLIDGLAGLGESLMGVIKSGTGWAIDAVLPDGLAGNVKDALGITKHHGGLWLSPNEHNAVIRKDETVLPPGASRKLDSFLNNTNTFGNNASGKGKGNGSTAQQISTDNSVKIDKVEIVVQADKLSKSDARNQAKMILEEIKRMGKEQQIRQFS